MHVVSRQPKRGESSTVGCYALGEAIASGGMATVHLGRLVASAGFSRTVAIKRMHPHLCEDPSFVESFADEARLVARIRHPNVAPTLDVVRAEGELLIVMEYVDGESLAALSRGRKVPVAIVASIVAQMLHGLHAAHEAKSESGRPLGIVHRDVSPQNVIVGADGVARLLDFGIARTTNRATTTRQDEVKGKLAYMAPEQIRREEVTRRTDVFAAGVVLWELLTSKRLFASENEGATLEKILVGWVAPASSIDPDVPAKLDDVALRALDADPNNRFETARDMAIAIEDAVRPALAREVGAWVEETAGPALARRRALVERAEKQRGGAMTSVVLGSPVTGDEGPIAEGPTSEEEPTLATEDTVEVSPLEPTVTAFAEDSVGHLWNDGSSRLTATAPSVERRKKSSADLLAVSLFVVAAGLALVVGARYRAQRAEVPESTFSSPPPAEVVPVDPAPTFAAPRPPPLPVVAAPPPAVTAEPEPEPPPAFTVTTIPIAPPPAPARRVARPRAPTKQPCVAKTDPTTQKRIYQGDCD